MSSKSIKALIKRYCNLHESLIETSDETTHRVLGDALRAYERSRVRLGVVETVGVHPVRGTVEGKKSETTLVRSRQEMQNENPTTLTFDEAYRKYGAMVKGFAEKLFDKWNHEEFESLVWERIHNLIEEGRFEHVSSERGFVYSILRRVAWDQFATVRAQYEMISLSVLSDEQECPPSPAKDPHDIAARRELLKAIVQYADTLAQPLPRIFQHYFLEGQNSAWISRKLHMNPNTVRFHIYSLRRKIDERFGASY